MFLTLWRFDGGYGNIYCFVFIRALIVAITCVVHNSCEMWKRLELGHVNDENKMNNLAKFRINELSILKDEKTAQKNEKKKGSGIYSNKKFIGNIIEVWLFTLYLECISHKFLIPYFYTKKLQNCNLMSHYIDPHTHD